jgi:dephospho-CoA kinase
MRLRSLPLAGAESSLDAVVVVSAGQEMQRERVLARPGMTQEALDRILARQVCVSHA